MSGAIAILFLFVVMMLNLQLAELNAVGSEYTQNLPLGIIIGSLFIFELVSIIPFNYNINVFNFNTITNIIYQIQLGIINWFNNIFLGIDINNNTINIHQTFNIISPDTQFSNFIQVESIGYSIYTIGAIWLIIASIILLLAIVGPISLSINKNYNYTPLYYIL